MTIQAALVAALACLICYEGKATIKAIRPALAIFAEWDTNVEIISTSIMVNVTNDAGMVYQLSMERAELIEAS